MGPKLAGSNLAQTGIFFLLLKNPERTKDISSNIRDANNSQVSSQAITIVTASINNHTKLIEIERSE